MCIVGNKYIGWLIQYAITVVGKHTKLTEKQTGMETQKRTFIDVIKKGKLPHDLLNKGPVEKLKEVFGKELNRIGRAS